MEAVHEQMGAVINYMHPFFKQKENICLSKAHTTKQTTSLIELIERYFYPRLMLFFFLCVASKDTKLSHPNYFCRQASIPNKSVKTF